MQTLYVFTGITVFL